MSDTHMPEESPDNINTTAVDPTPATAVEASTIPPSTDNTTTAPLKYTEVFDPIEGKLKSVRDWVIPVPMTDVEIGEIDKLIEDYSKQASAKMNPNEARDAIMEYANRIRTTYTGHWIRSEYKRIFENAEKLQQKVESERGPIFIKGQSIGSKDTTLAGPIALMALQSTIGIGRPIKIPLWHSGIVLTVSNFKESESLALAHSIDVQRVELGYSTQGYLFTGKDVNIVMEIVDFILNHVIATNIKGWMVGDIAILKELILVSDLPFLMAGALEAMYPSGYPTEHHCKNSGTDKCDYRTETKVDVGDMEFHIDGLMRFARCAWVDVARVPNSAKQHMSAGSGTHDKEHILEYQKTFNIVEPLSEPILVGHAEIRLSFHQPNLATYSELGHYWIEKVIAMVDSTMAKFNDLSTEAKVNKRKQYIEEFQRVQRFQKEAPWIKTIQFKDLDSEEPYLIEDSKTIFTLLETITADPDLIERALEQVNQYKENTQVTFTGIPNFRCPVCGESQATGDALKHGIIPMDMVGYFFTIVGYLMLRIGLEKMER